MEVTMADKTPKTVLIYDDQWKLIEDKAAEVGSPGNTSAGLRAVLAEYERLKAKSNRDNGNDS